MDSLLISLSIILLGLMYGILYVEKAINKNIPGLNYWSNSFLFGFIFSCYLVFQPLLPELFSILVFQSCSFFLSFFTLIGSRAYIGKKKLSIAKISTLYFFVLSFSIFFTLIIPNQPIRFIFSSIISGTFFLLSAKTIASGGIDKFPKRYLFSFACLFHGLFLLLRPVFVNLDFIGKFSFSNIVSVSQLLIFESIVALVLLSLGILSLTNEYILNQVNKLAELDSLTNVFNRRSFMLIFNKLFSQNQRTKSSLSLLAIDLDYFKKINDTWGHSTGDKALCHFVDVAQNCLRESDVLGRLGGEEFAILLPNTNLENAELVANRLIKSLNDTPFVHENNLINLTASIGLTNCSIYEPLDIALKRADNAMYLAKNNGRNRVEIILE